jgi:hypothetical protein
LKNGWDEAVAGQALSKLFSTRKKDKLFRKTPLSVGSIVVWSVRTKKKKKWIFYRIGAQQVFGCNR